MAERILAEGGATPEERLTYAFRLATARRPAPAELSVLLKVYQSQLADYQADKDAAAKLLSYGDSKRNEALDPSDEAAWTMVANLILNLDEVVTKE
jgi:hypothetical protein